MKITIRQAFQADLSQLLLLIEGFYRYFDYPYDPLVHRRLLADFLNSPQLGSLYLIEQDAQPVGYVALTFGFTFELKGRDAFVDELFILDKHRDQGVGRQALAAIGQEARRLGLVALHLQTESFNPDAKRLYESFGFRESERSTLTWLTTIEWMLRLGVGI